MTSTVGGGLPLPTAGGDVVLTLLGMLEKAFVARDWILLSAVLLMGVVALLRYLEATKALPDAWVPWATIAIAVLTSVGLGLQARQPWLSIVTTGLVVGATAVGSWETIGKLIRALLAKIRGDAPPAPPILAVTNPTVAKDTLPPPPPPAPGG